MHIFDSLNLSFKEVFHKIDMEMLGKMPEQLHEII